jgi:apolipoprotein N-acyltransferase
MLVFRCIENRRWAIRSANTGISAIISASGRIEKQSPIFVPYMIDGQVPALDGTTFYMRYGDVFAYACALASIAVIIWAYRMKKRRPKS